MVTIVARFDVNTGKETDFLPVMTELIKASKAEEGCVEYVLHQHTEKPSSYCLIEKWKHQKAIDIHNNSSHFKTLIPKLLELAKIEIDVYKYPVSFEMS